MFRKEQLKNHIQSSFNDMYVKDFPELLKHLTFELKNFEDILPQAKM